MAGGEVVALLGPNGGVKATLVAVLAGDVAADAGAVLLPGRALGGYGAAEHARHRALLPQAAALSFPFRS
ncbi:ATP-binding cassette domain-containing protein, partial [Streptomyces sp. SP17BM10]|uniref:ATP-binding cassette domain-containing protein n=1 Tax=Streptomyces sp. SP17BM10 TaxID=3002530 RepID=UPI002E781142